MKHFADLMKQMQSHLGELHDCDVWIEKVRPHAAVNSRKPDPERSSAAVWLLTQFAKRRTKTYVAALELWSRWNLNALELALAPANNSK